MKIKFKQVAISLWPLLLLALSVTGAHGQNQTSRRDILRRRNVSELTTLQPRNSVRVEVRYSKDYGYQSDSMYGPTSCAAFAVDFNWDADVPFRRLEGQYPKMRESGSYYACEFLLTDLPLNRKITITASVGGDPTAAWNKGGQAKPPAGSHRAILDGTRKVTLTDGEPRASLSFEMIYEEPRSVERPRFKVPLKP